LYKLESVGSRYSAYTYTVPVYAAFVAAVTTEAALKDAVSPVCKAIFPPEGAGKAPVGVLGFSSMLI
jgi:hypothetical protein